MTAQAAGPGKPFLYVVVCAAGVASGVTELIAAAQERDWEVGVLATPSLWASSTPPPSRRAPDA